MVVSDVADHSKVRELPKGDVLMVIDLGGGCPLHGTKEGGPAPRCTVLGPGEHERPLAVAPDPGGQAVELQQLGEFLRIAPAEL